MKTTFIFAALIAAASSVWATQPGGGVPGNCGNGQGSGNACLPGGGTVNAPINVAPVISPNISPTIVAAPVANGGKASSDANAAVIGSGNGTANAGVVGSGNSKVDINNQTSISTRIDPHFNVSATGGAGGAGGSATIGNTTANVGDVKATIGDTKASVGAITNSTGPVDNNVKTGDNKVNVNVEGDTNVNHYKAAASSAIAPMMTQTAPCSKAFTIGVQAVAGGASMGVPLDSDVCETQEIAKTSLQMGDKPTAEEVMCSLAKYREARARANRPCAADKRAEGAAPNATAMGGAPSVGTVDATGRIVQ